MVHRVIPADRQPSVQRSGERPPPPPPTGTAVRRGVSADLQAVAVQPTLSEMMPGDIGAFGLDVWPGHMGDHGYGRHVGALAETIAVPPQASPRELAARRPPEPESSSSRLANDFPYHDPFEGCRFVGVD